MAEEEKIDNLDVDNLRLFEEQICPQDILPVEDNQITQEKILQQDSLFQMLRYCAKEKHFISTYYCEPYPNGRQKF